MWQCCSFNQSINFIYILSSCAMFITFVQTPLQCFTSSGTILDHVFCSCTVRFHTPSYMYDLQQFLWCSLHICLDGNEFLVKFIKALVLWSKIVLGAIGHTMAGTGLPPETLEIIYASNVVGHMLSGKAIT